MVLLSLVRSNPEGKIGFVGVSNRICVGLCRAKHGMFVAGNFNMFSQRSRLWQTICSVAKTRGQYGNALSLSCPNHPDAPNVLVEEPVDFSKVPLGSCNKLAVRGLI